MSPSVNTWTDVRTAKCFVCGTVWFGRVAPIDAKAHATKTGHLVVVETLTRHTYNPDAAAPAVREAMTRAEITWTRNGILPEAT